MTVSHTFCHNVLRYELNIRDNQIKKRNFSHSRPVPSKPVEDHQIKEPAAPRAEGETEDDDISLMEKDTQVTTEISKNKPLVFFNQVYIQTCVL